MNRNDPLRTWATLLLATAVAVAICIRYVDRRVAEFVATYLPVDTLRGILDPIFRDLGGIALLALVAMFACGLWIVTGRRMPLRIRVPLLCCVAAMFSLASEIILKQLFGRFNADVYFNEGLYGFRLLHGFVNIDAFPSGTAMTVSTITAVLWLETPRSRVPAVILSLLLCLFTVITNRHWVGDLVGGAFLGATIGWLTQRAYVTVRTGTEPGSPSA